MDKLRKWARDTQLLERLNGDVEGWYPRIGGITRGSGFAGGPGIRSTIPGSSILLDVSGAVSIRGYKAFDARARWLEAAGKRIQLWTEFRYEDFTEEDFFGTGMTTTAATRTSYAFDSTDVRVRMTVTPWSWVRFTALTGFMQPDVGTGTDDQFPSTETMFTDIQAAGLLEQPDFLHTTLGAEIDYRDLKGNTASGGLYRVSYSEWDDVTLGRYDFRRVDAHLVQFVPLVPSKRHVISGRVGASYVNNAVGDRVPFYFLPYVGGMDTIRSFREFRFKDENAMWLSAEYRWRPKRFLSVAAFADAGEVAEDWQDLDLHGMRTGYGVGVGLHQGSETIIRMDFGAGGGEGWQFFLKLRPTF